MANPRITFPVILAVVTAVGVMGFLWLQLPKGTIDLAALPGKALPMLDPLTTDEPAAPAIDTRDEALLSLRQGDLLAAKGQWSLAAEEYRRAVDANGGLPALRKLAQAQMQKRDIAGARQTAQEMKDAGAKEEDLLLLETIIMLRTGEIQQATDLLASSAGSPQKAYGLSLLAIIQGSHEEAKIQLSAVINGWEPVLRSYARALAAAYDEYALFPESTPLHLQALLGRALAQVQECELALPMVGRVTQQLSDYRDAWIVQGYCELTTERHREALASLERAYQIDPEKPETQYFLARAYAALDDHNNAVTFLQYSLQNGFEPKSEVRSALAAEAVKAGNLTLAIEQYDALTSGADATAEMYAQFITVTLGTGQKEEAYVKAMQGAQRWPNDPTMQLYLAKAAKETGRADEAKVAITRSLELDPTSSEAQELAGEL